MYANGPAGVPCTPRSADEPLAPAEAGRGGRRRQWAGRQTRAQLLFVELPRRDVVRRGGVAEGGEVLDLPAAGAELGLAAAVRADVVGRAVLVGRQQIAQAADSRGLEVDAPGAVSQRLEVGNRVDGLVPGDTVHMRSEHRLGLGRERRVLDPSVVKALGDTAVERRIGALIYGRTRVAAIEIDRLDCARGGELLDELVRPGARGVELELQPGVLVEAAADGVDRGGLAEAQGVDEAHRLGVAADHVMQRTARLSKRQVQGGALERPAPVEAVGRELRRSGEEVE